MHGHLYFLGHPLARARTVLKTIPQAMRSANLASPSLTPSCAKLWGQTSPKRTASSLSATTRPASVGMSIHDVDTPALLVDLAKFEQNCRKLKDIKSQYPHIQIRPHVKVHKCPALAHMMLKLLEATGVCCQKVSEAEAMVAGGVHDVFLSNEVVTHNKIQRLLALNLIGAQVSVCVDSEVALTRIGAVASSMGAHVDVVVEVNVGQDRCGVDSVDDAVRLAELAASHRLLTFKGVQAYHGGIQHVRDPKNREAAVAAAVDKGRHFVRSLEAAGLHCGTITGGGSGTYRLDAASGFYNEVQPGSFCFGDADYGRNIQLSGEVGEWEQSLWVMATVMSRSEERSMVVLDAGIKAVSLDSGPPVVPLKLTDGVQTEFQNGGDEHGKLLWPLAVHQVPTQLPDIGSTLRLQPGHCDPTVNLYDWIVAYRDDTVVAVLPITARGPGS